MRMEIKFKIRRTKVDTIVIPEKFLDTPPKNHKLESKLKVQGIVILDNERKLIDGYATLLAKQQFQKAKKVKCFILDDCFEDVMAEEVRIIAEEFKKEWYTLKIEEDKNGNN